MNFIDYGIIINRNGQAQQKVKCPECTPGRKKKHLQDLSVNTKEGIWNCHHCGWSGSLLIKEIKTMAPKRIYKKPEPRKPVIMDKAAGYLESRGISVDTQSKYNVSHESAWMPQTSKEENCLVFNYFLNGELINRKYRDGKKNHKMEKDCRLIFYNPSDSIGGSSKKIYITEGEIDCLSMLEMGFSPTISIPNGAPPENVELSSFDFSYLPSLQEMFPDFEEVVLVMDTDKVGSRARDEIARRIGMEKCKKVSYPEDCKDINDVLVKHGQEKASECVKDAKTYPIAGLYSVEDIEGDLERYFDNGFEPGIRTGWHGVDELYLQERKSLRLSQVSRVMGKALLLITLW